MADSVVTFLVQNLPQLLIQEANYLAGVEDQVNSLHKELDLINAFLMDSEWKRKEDGRNEDETVKQVVKQIRDVAHEAEDVIDLYIFHEAHQRRRSVLGKAVRFFPHKSRLHNIGKKIEGINVEINKIYNSIERFGIKRDEAEARMDAAVAKAEENRRKNVDLEDVVGFVDDSNTLVKQLTEGKLALDVNTIVGMGGLGKSTLAKKVYSDDLVRNHFNCRAWVYVSQDFRCKDLLIEILKSEMETSESNYHISQNPALLDEYSKKKLENMDVDELIKKLEKHLLGKKYLVVLDDVWTTQVWNEVKSAFPDNLNGSRILITSRLKYVAKAVSRGTPPHCLQFLNNDESWELLRKKVFKGQYCSPELDPVGREIAKSCGGLPLSIVVLGGVLANEENIEHKWKWRDYDGHVNWYLTREKKKCQDILSLSYTHLPRYLKACFLYAGVYPKGLEIPVRQLIEMWIAEGFIQQIGEKTEEDVAEIYLGELIDRSLIQVARRRRGGGAKTLRIHDLLRDLCISVSKEEKFFEVRTDANLDSTESTRRLSILCSPARYISSNRSHSDRSYPRSLLFFDQEKCVLEDEHWKWVLKNFILVRVLNFGHTIPHSIPNKIEKLIHLRYLRIESGELDAIPPSVCNLWNLETLDARSSRLKCLPIGIWKLQRLRNLYMSGPVSFPDPIDTNINPLEKLQVLSTIIVYPQTASLMVDGKLPNVRKLGICYLWGENVLEARKALESLQRLCHLQTLKIINCADLPRSPNSFLSTITKITLNCVFFKDIHMEMLGNLPKLRILRLQKCIFHVSLRVIADSFRELEVLKLDNLSIMQWTLERGAMPGLRHLVIKRCTSLINLPEELCSMTSLRDVEVLWTTLKLARMLQQLQTLVDFELQIYPPPDDVYYRSLS